MFKEELHYISAVGARNGYMVRRVSDNKWAFANGGELTPLAGSNKDMKKVLERLED
jgi:hypothetical protein